MKGKKLLIALALAILVFLPGSEAIAVEDGFDTRLLPFPLLHLSEQGGVGGALFFAAYDDRATWISQLSPAFGEKRFFFQDELEQYYRENIDTCTADDFE